MAINDDALRQLGVELKRQAKKQSKDVDDAFVIELGNYARHQGVEELDQNDTLIVLAKIGEEALNEHTSLSSSSVWATIQRICRPKTGFDLCVGAARKILVENGRTDAVERLDDITTKLLMEWKLDD